MPNKFQVKRTSVSGRTPNTTNSGNSQYIDAGEFALNMADDIVYTSDGTNLIYVGANQVNQRITNSLTLDNDRNLYWKTVNTSATVGMRQQTDDNFVFYTTNTLYGQRPVWSIFANSDTSALSISTPTVFNANIDIGGVALTANGTTGSAGQVLSSNGTATYWASPGVASVNQAAQYVWTNTHTFSANVAFTGNNISLVTNTGSILFAGSTDTNWRIGRNTAAATKFFYTNNTLDIIAAGSPLEGVSIGQPGANSYLETGYAGTFTRLPIYVGNSSVNVTINSTSFTGTANNSSYLGGTAAASYVQNTDSRTLSGNIVFSGSNTTVNAVFRVVNATANVFFAGADGNIGIGETNPLRKLTVRGDSAGSLTVAAFYNADTTANNGSVFSFRSDTTGTGATTFQEFAAITGRYGNHDHATRSGSLDFYTVENGTGANRMSVVANGNVGIGTDTPTNKLHILGGGFRTTGGDTFIETNLDSTAGYGLTLQKSRGTYSSKTAATSGDIIGGMWGAGHDGSSYQSRATVRFIVDDVVSTGIVPTAIAFRTGTSTTTEYMRITSSGNVGIGNTAPAFKLRVDGTTSLAGAVSDITTLAAGNTSVTGFVNATTSVNSALLTVGTSFIANTTGAYHTGVVNAASHTVGATFTANATLVNAAAINITGQVNTATLYAATSANIASAVQANATGVYTTGTVNAASHTVGSSFIANSTAIVGTGFANITTSVNSALLTVGTSFIANTTGAYHTGVVNAASHTVGTSTIANSTGVYTGVVNAASHTVGTAFTANSTVVNAVSYYSGSLLIANSTVSNATHLGGYTWSAPAALGGGTANTGAFTTLTTSSTALFGGYTQIGGSASQVGIKFTGAGTQYGLGIQPASDGTTMMSFFNAAGSVVGTITQTATNLVYNGYGASFTQTNTATLYATTSVNVASAVQANATGVYTTGTMNAASHTVGSSFIANTTGAYHTGIVNAASHTTTGITANATGVYPASNTTGTALGSSTQRWVINANTINGTGDWTTSANVGIGTAASATYRLQVNGAFAATTKSFLIDHPTKPDMKLRYGSLEGPENGVYVRGRANTNTIELPEYWMQLVDENSITVDLTAIGKKQDLYVKSIVNNVVTVAGSRTLDYFYVVLAERKDVDKLVVEF